MKLYCCGQVKRKAQGDLVQHQGRLEPIFNSLTEKFSVKTILLLVEIFETESDYFGITVESCAHKPRAEIY